MSLAPRLAPGLSQRLTLAPRLSEALRLLALPTLELTAALTQALQSNAMLEQTEPEEADATEHAAAEGPDSWEHLEWSSAPAAPAPVNPPESAEPAADLRRHLIEQLALERLSPRDHAIAVAVVDALDDDGYLREAEAEVRDGLPDMDPPADDDEIEAVIQRVQRLEPLGVAARSPAECLLLQLTDRPEETPGLEAARTLLGEHFAELGRADLPRLARLAGAAAHTVEQALRLIRALDPYPGARLAPTPAEYLVPELIARRSPEGWRVEPNPRTTPRLSINEHYASWLAAHRKGDGADALAAQLEEARWLVRALAQREDTLLRVGAVLVRRQAGFVEEGPGRLAPLTLRDVADEIGMHESTVSRAVQGKSLAAPRGVIPLRHFFSAAVSKNGDTEYSSRAVQERLRALIAAEDAAAPLSDAALAAALEKKGIRIARRTVAKYREALGLASARERRRAIGR